MLIDVTVNAGSDKGPCWLALRLMLSNHGSSSVMNYRQYYTNQVGAEQSVYTGRLYYRGHGLGNLLGTLFRTVAPML